MKKLAVYTFSEWNQMILDIHTQQKLIRLLESKGQIGISDGDEVKLYAKIDQVGKIKYVHRELIEKG